jgi:hypothetical protein
VIAAEALLRVLVRKGVKQRDPAGASPEPTALQEVDLAAPEADVNLNQRMRKLDVGIIAPFYNNHTSASTPSG